LDVIDVNPAEQTPALLEHMWRYFELHANQRMTVFNFYLVLSGAIAAGLAATLQGSARLALVGIVLGALLALVRVRVLEA
jgi:ABC-type amino acid transport system permease subunit